MDKDHSWTAQGTICGLSEDQLKIKYVCLNKIIIIKIIIIIIMIYGARATTAQR